MSGARFEPAVVFARGLIIWRILSVFDHLRLDFQRYKKVHSDRAPLVAFFLAILSYGFLAVLVYRYGRWTRLIRPRVLSYPFKLIYVLLQLIVDILFGINISTNADIGPGLYVAHFGGIFLHGNMGRNCSVTQGVTIGYKGGGKSTNPPSIGDNVYIGAGAVIVGDVRVGHNVVVGANTTVVKSVPDNHMVVSAEPRVIFRKAC